MGFICENVIDMVTGVEEYFLCSVTSQKCCCQRYCPNDERVINTEGAKICKARTKKLNIEDDITDVELSQEVLDVVPEVEKNDEIFIKKEKGTVTLVANTYVVYDYNGKSCYKNGHFNVKVGDKIEV